ncbi:GNAT family N-acetyltransferase [Adhaeribacter sp. BT258]|uniref:GNAT family N-acetyltransferase n=1 Tax=Adhaeribacter terrigena TaxID=2793070 RepID=A0ABS1BYV4_9BACT|nr:GNAT family N-acetyltransferase [Adhaeribacter terrigena]MBK0402294.1 GNAT family N-acetyltransferase [Adhaeribacter terrigena]
MQISETIMLEPLADHHVAPVFRLIEQNRTNLKTWLQWVDNIHTEADFEQFLQGVKQRIAAKMALPFFIRHEGEIAGNIGLYHFDHLNKTAAIGYWLGEAFQGKGIITQACRELIRYGFTELALNRIELKCGIGNHKSQAIPERLGFTREGILRQAELLNGGFQDLYLYSLLKQDWEKHSQH